MIEENDLKELKTAKKLLENPGLAIRISNLIGKPIENALDSLPKNWSKKIGEITESALIKVADVASLTMKDEPKKKSSNLLHKISVAFTGASGGFFGLPALAIELPTSTTIMFRSIMEIARENGESVGYTETKLACLEVFALGGDDTSDDAETAYFATRSILAKSVTDTTKHIAAKGLTEEGTPVLLKFIQKIAERFSIQVTEKAAGQAVPIIGAFAGALINVMFMDHFQDMAKGHFTVRRLERKYSPEEIKEAYEKTDKLEGKVAIIE